MERRIEPEILDELPADDPRAIRSRKDLRRVNWFMGNPGHIAHALKKYAPQGTSSILELGAGDGTLMLKVAQKLAWRRPIDFYLLDRRNILSDQTRGKFEALGWNPKVLQKEMFGWINEPEPASVDVAVCNLFAHHFSEAELRELFEALAQRTKLFVACEPWRNRFAPGATDFLGLIGCGKETRHDARISVQAGFRESELSALWPVDSGFQCIEKGAGLFSHLFVASSLPAR